MRFSHLYHRSSYRERYRAKQFSFVADVDEQAQDLFLRLVKDLAEKENVTEKLKAENAMLWVQRMNSIRNRATEVVNLELIYTI